LGMRFQYLKIPKGVTIDAAHLEFFVDEATADPTNVTIQAEAADNAAPFTDTNYDVTSRARTSAVVPWAVPAWNVAGVMEQSPDISDVIQEIVDRPGWDKDQSMAIIIEGTGRRAAESYEKYAGRAPVLHVEYSTPSPGC